MLNSKNIDKWNNMKFGLVLSGGGAKGAYEAGAIKAMGEMDVIEKVYGVSGTSVGALNTLVFAMDDVALMEEHRFVYENTFSADKYHKYVRIPFDSKAAPGPKVPWQQ